MAKKILIVNPTSENKRDVYRLSQAWEKHRSLHEKWIQSQIVRRRRRNKDVKSSLSQEATVESWKE